MKRKLFRAVISGAVVLAAACAQGCARWQAPTLKERIEILQTVQGLVRQGPGYIEAAADVAMKVKDNTAVARYMVVQPSGRPLPAIKMYTTLRRARHGWVVTSHEPVYPWWWGLRKMLPGGP